MTGSMLIGCRLCLQSDAVSDGRLQVAEHTSTYSWVDIKAEERTIEKLRRSYFGRVEFILDVVRGSLIVDNVAEVKVLLEIICKDRDVYGNFDIILVTNCCVAVHCRATCSTECSS